MKCTDMFCYILLFKLGYVVLCYVMLMLWYTFLCDMMELFHINVNFFILLLKVTLIINNLLALIQNFLNTYSKGANTYWN